MKLIGMIIGMGLLAMLFQTGIHGVVNLMNGQTFWHQWTDRLDMAVGLGVILGTGIWICRTFPLRKQGDPRWGKEGRTWVNGIRLAFPWF